MPRIPWEDPRVGGPELERSWPHAPHAGRPSRERTEPARPGPGPAGRGRVRHRRRAHRHGQRARGRLEAAVRRLPGGTGGAPGRAVPSLHPEADYLRHVDGRPRYDGVAAFLASRGITVPWGDPDHPPGRETVCGLGNTKDGHFTAYLRDHGAKAFPTSAALVRRLRAAGIRTAVVSASRNMLAVLASAGLRGLFDAEVDGLEAERRGLAGKPDPALFLEAARRLGVEPARAAVVEDALAGVEAGRRGGFGLVIGVNRGDQAAALASGAPGWWWTTSASSPSRAATSGPVAGDHLDPGLRRFRPGVGAAPGGVVHARQRLLRHPRGRSRGGGRRGPLPRHLCRRLLQPGGQPGRRPRGRERGPGQPAQLAAPDLPGPGRGGGSTWHGWRCSASARA